MTNTIILSKPLSIRNRAVSTVRHLAPTLPIMARRVLRTLFWNRPPVRVVLYRPKIVPDSSQDLQIKRSPVTNSPVTTSPFFAGLVAAFKTVRAPTFLSDPHNTARPSRGNILRSFATSLPLVAWNYDSSLLLSLHKSRSESTA